MKAFEQIGRAIAAKGLTIGCAALLLSSCSKSDNRFANEEINDNKVEPYEFIRFDKEVMSMDPNHIESEMGKLLGKYGRLFDMYLQKGVEVGPAYAQGDTTKVNASTAQVLRQEILGNQGYQAFFHAEDSVYANGMNAEAEELTAAMNRFHHFLPNKPLPSKLIAMFSCFGPKMAVGDHNELMVSMEYYIGSTFDKYKYVDGLYSYDAINLDRSMMVRDLVLGWIYYNYSDPMDGNCRLIDEMLYQGKLMYIMEACLPQDSKEMLMGYTEDQWEWCEKNEKNMWDYIKENKHLYSYDRLTISKYINPAPHTAYFPYDESKDNTPEAPGKAGIWLGWRIVGSYMKKHENATINDLMELTDSQKLLEESGYNPK